MGENPYLGKIGEREWNGPHSLNLAEKEEEEEEEGDRLVRVR